GPKAVGFRCHLCLVVRSVIVDRENPSSLTRVFPPPGGRVPNRPRAGRITACPGLGCAEFDGRTIISPGTRPWSIESPRVFPPRALALFGGSIVLQLAGTSARLTLGALLCSFSLGEIAVRQMGETDQNGQFRFRGYAAKPRALPRETLRKALEAYSDSGVTL